jgi:RimJ/RimL family protein N-acetyltransferase
MNLPHLVEAWESAWPVPRWRDYLQAQCAGDYARPFVGSMHGEDSGYVEVYCAAKDSIATRYAADPYDVGLHAAIAELSIVNKGLGPFLLPRIVASVFEVEPRCRRIMFDPDHRNASARRLCEYAGCTFLGEPRHEQPQDGVVRVAAHTGRRPRSALAVHRSLGNYLFEFGACALDFGEDGFGGCCPDVGFGIGVVGVEVCLDAGDQIGHAAKYSAAQVLVGQVAEPAFNLVEPRRRWREVQVKTLVPLQPPVNVKMLMGAVAVQDQLHLQPGGYLPVDGIEESDELAMAVPTKSFAP